MNDRQSFAIADVRDFTLTGDGSSAGWRDAPWHDLTRVSGDAPYRTRCKLARSATGLYLLADVEDQVLDCTFTSDGEDLFTEDVIEWFLQPDPAMPLYVEYEISPLGNHLVLIVPNDGERFHGWTGWKMDGMRTIRRAVQVRGGERRPGARVTGWSIEAFLPWDLFRGFANTPPRGPWHGNVYRIDRGAKWALGAATGGRFHDFARFPAFTFA